MTDDNKEKRFSLSKEERDEFLTLKRIFDDLYVQQQGIRRMMDFEMVKIQVRVGVAEEKAPEGYTRRMRLDPDKYELVVEDVKNEEKIEIATK